MKWETVTSTIGHKAFALWNNGRKLVTLVFNSSSNSARIEYADEKRVFLIRDEGFLKSKTVVRNEYGVRIAHAGVENNEPFIMMNDQRFFYSVDGANDGAVTLYKESKDKPVATFDLGPTSTKKSFGKNRSLNDKTQYSLLTAICWYLFKPGPDHVAEFAI